MNGMSDLALSILMAAAFALTGGGIWLAVKAGERKRGLLMVGAGLIMFANVIIWTLPTK